MLGDFSLAASTSVLEIRACSSPIHTQAYRLSKPAVAAQCCIESSHSCRKKPMCLLHAGIKISAAPKTVATVREKKHTPCCRGRQHHALLFARLLRFETSLPAAGKNTTTRVASSTDLCSEVTNTGCGNSMLHWLNAGWLPHCHVNIRARQIEIWSLQRSEKKNPTGCRSSMLHWVKSLWSEKTQVTSACRRTHPCNKWEAGNSQEHQHPCCAVSKPPVTSSARRMHACYSSHVHSAWKVTWSQISLMPLTTTKPMR